MLRTYFQENFYDMPVDVAQKYADAIRDAIVAGVSFDSEKEKGFFISKNRGFEDKLYVGNIHRIENHLYWKDEELADDDEIVNVVVIDGPVTRDGDGCSYGSKDHRDQIIYANTIPQVKGHIFIINTPGGAASARIDYEQAIADCREKGKPTVAWIDGMCCSAGQLVAALCDRTIVMNGKDTMGCIGTMCAFWGVAHDTVSRDGFRYIELVSVTSPDKNVEYREATEGKYERLQAELDKLGEEFRETVRQNRPLVKDEHLTGKTFDAEKVMGALVDEIGDYDRAIQAVFDLAGGTLKSAREATVVGNEPGAGTNDPAETAELATTKNENNMPQEEKMAAEMLEAQAAAEQSAQEETTAVEQQAQEEAPASEQPAQEEAPASEEPAAEEAPASEEPAQEEAPASEEPAAEEAPASEEPAQEEAPASEEPAAEEAPASEEPAQEEAPASEEPAQEEAPASEAANIDDIQEALHNAEGVIADRDREIAALKEERDAVIRERDDISASLEKAGEDYAEQGNALSAAETKAAELQETVNKLQKQVKDLQAEVKELSERPAPMTDGNAGIPADNGTGEAPKQNQCRIKSGMGYKEIRAAYMAKN